MRLFYQAALASGLTVGLAFSAMAHPEGTATFRGRHMALPYRELFPVGTLVLILSH